MNRKGISDNQLNKIFDTISTPEDLKQLETIFKKVHKSCEAVDSGINLADLLNDPENRESLLETFKKQAVFSGIQNMLKLALQGYSVKSFTLLKPLENQKEFEFLFRTLGGWSQFSIVISCHLPNGMVHLINPAKRSHWKILTKLPAGTLISIYLRLHREKRDYVKEESALEKAKTVFETVPYLSSRDMEENAPVEYQKKKTTRRSVLPTIKAAPAKREPLMESCEIVINKIDTFVHAGNAQLIISHVKDYRDKIKMYVMRDKKKEVPLNVDSIWGEEIRNGERVVFEFFGFRPQPEFIRDLAKKVNKYTQMDKIMPGE